MRVLAGPGAGPAPVCANVDVDDDEQRQQQQQQYLQWTKQPFPWSKELAGLKRRFFGVKDYRCS